MHKDSLEYKIIFWCFEDFFVSKKEKEIYAKNEGDKFNKFNSKEKMTIIMKNIAKS